MFPSDINRSTESRIVDIRIALRDLNFPSISLKIKRLFRNTMSCFSLIFALLLVSFASNSCAQFRVHLPFVAASAGFYKKPISPSPVEGSTAQPVPFIFLPAFAGSFKRLFIASKTLPIAGVQCARLHYTLESILGFSFATSGVRNDAVEHFTGSFIRENPDMAQFTLVLTGVLSAPFVVYKLGPILYDKYEYAVVGSPDLRTVAIDARDEHVFALKYEKEVFRFVEKVLGVQREQFFDLRGGSKCFAKLGD